MDNKIIGNIGGKDILGAEYYAMHWENRIRAEHGINLRTHYGIGNGQVVGQAVDSNGNSLIYTQKQFLPTSYLDIQFTPSGVKIVTVDRTNPVVIPFKYN